MFFILVFGVGIDDGHIPRFLLARIFGNLSRFFSKQQKNGNLLLGIVEKWWHFFEMKISLVFCVNFMKNQHNIFQFYFSFLAGHINLILCLIMTSLQK